MSGTTWTVKLDGKPLTWTVMMAEWKVAAPGGRKVPVARALLMLCPLRFDVADGLSARHAQQLVVWLREWLPEKGNGRLRLVPSIPTHEVARMRPEKPQRIRL